jgi:RecA/RadA recombinase
VSPTPRAHSGAKAAAGAQAARVEALLRDLASSLSRGSGEAARQSGGCRRLATGLPAVDALIGGGFPSGRLCEIAGPLGSGRSSIAQALLAQVTRAGEWSALVDAADAFDAASAQAAGVALERVLWVRPQGALLAARVCARLLELRGFAVVALDLTRAPLAGAEAPLAGAGAPLRGAEALPASAWQKLARAAAASGSALVVLSQERVTGTHSELALETRRARAHFSGTPALLEALEIEAQVVRQRAGPLLRVASLRLCADTRAA